MKKVIDKARFNLEELKTINNELKTAINFCPLTYIDNNPNSNTLTPNLLIFGRNIHEKCYVYKSKDFTENGARSSLKYTAEIIYEFFLKFDNEYIVSLQEEYFLS